MGFRIAAGTLIAAMLLVAGVLLFGDLAFLRGPVERAATAALGREVRIAGPISVSLLPRPGVDVQGLEVANAAWAEAALLLRVERLRLEPDPRALLDGRLQLQALDIRGVRIALQWGPEGYNWPVPPARGGDGAAGESAGGAAFAPPERISLDDLALVLQTPGAPARAVTVDQARWRYGPASGARLEASLAVAGRDLELRATAAERGSEAWRLEAELRSREDRLRIELPELVSGRAPSGVVDLAGPELAELLDAFGLATPALGPYALEAQFALQADVLHVSSLEARAGESDAGGALQVALGDARPRVTGTLSAQRLALRPWYDLRLAMPPDAGRPTEPALSGFARLLAGVDLDLRLRVESLTGTGIPFNAVDGRVVVADGAIRVPALSATAGGHVLDASGEVRVQPPGLVVAAQATSAANDADARIRIVPGTPVRISGTLAARRLTDTLLRDLTQAALEANRGAGEDRVADNPLAPVALDLKTEIGELIAGAQGLEDVRARLSSDEASLSLDIFGARSGPTRLDGKARLSWQSGQMALTAAVDGDRWVLGQTLPGLRGPERLQAQGERLTARARARGEDPQALFRDLRWEIEAEDSALVYRPRRGQPVDIEFRQVRMSVAPGEGLRVQAALRSQSTDVAMDLRTLPLRALREQRADIPLSVSLRLPRSELQAEGTAALVDHVPQLRLALQGRGVDLGDLGQLLQIPLPVRGAFEASAALRMDATTVSVDDFRYTSETASGQGRIGLEWGRAKPLLTLALDLDQFLVPDSPVPIDAEPQPEGASSDGPLIPETPLRLEGLRDFDADVRINVRSALVGETDLGRFGVDATLREGRLSLTRLYGTFAGGEIGMSGWVDATASPPVLALRGGFDGFDYGSMLKARGVTQAVEGQLGVGFDLIASGDSPRALASTATGSLALVGSEGVLPSALLDLWAGDLALILLPTQWTPSAQTRLNCVVSRFELDAGLAVADAILIDTDSTVIAGAAQIDLGNEQVVATFKPQARDATLFSLATPMQVRGSLSDPIVGPSESGAVTTLGKLAIGVANPATLLLLFADAGAGDANRCAAAVEALDAKGTVTAERRRKPVRGIVEAILSPFRRREDPATDQAPIDPPTEGASEAPADQSP